MIYFTISFSPMIFEAAPIRIASRGMPNTTHEASSWAMVMAPASFISRSPAAPSEPMPVRSRPMALRPATCATERNSTVDRRFVPVHRQTVKHLDIVPAGVRLEEQVTVPGRNQRDAAVDPGRRSPPPSRTAAPCR